MKLSRIQIVKRFRCFLDRLRLPIAVLVICGLLAIPIALIVPKLFQVFVDDVLSGGNMALFPYIAVGMLLAFGVQLANDAVQLACSNKIQNDFGYALREKIIDKYLHISQSNYSKHSTNELKLRVLDDVDKMGNFVREQVVDYFSGFITLFVTAGFCAFLNWRLLLLCLPVIPIMLLVDNCIGRGTRKINNEIRKMNEEYGAFEHNVFTMWKEVKLQCAEESAINKYCTYRKQLSKLGLVYIRYWMYREVFNDFKANYLTKVFVYIVGAFLAIQGEVTVGEIILFGQYYELLFNATNTITQRSVSFKANQPYYARIYETLEWTEEKNETDEHRRNVFPLEFHNVTFSYDGEHQVVENVSFAIFDGDKTVMAGSSGIGKSTVFGLALGLLKPQTGYVSYGSLPLEQWNIEDLYRQLGVVSQDGYLFNMTIRENLSISNPDVEDGVILEACHTAGIDDFISQLPDGLNTIIGEGGIKLSGGQRQRLLIARMLIKEPAFIYLDEATSAVDEETENKIIDGIISHKSAKTVLAISHKPAMQRKFARLLTVEERCVCEKQI